MKLEIRCPIKAARFGVVFAQLKSFSDQIILRPDHDGLSMQCMDSSQVCLFDARLAAGWFDTYEFSEGDPSSLGVVPRVLAVALGTRKDNQHVTVAASPGEDRIQVTIDGDDAHLDKLFSVQLIDVEAEVLDLGSQEDSQVDLTMETKKVVELVTQLHMFDSQVDLRFKDEEIWMEARGDEGGLLVKVTLGDVIEYATAGELEQQFSLAYLSTICGFGKLAAQTEMCFTSERPMEARFNLGEDSRATLYLAPKLGSDPYE